MIPSLMEKLDESHTTFSQSASDEAVVGIGSRFRYPARASPECVWAHHSYPIAWESTFAFDKLIHTERFLSRYRDFQLL